MRLSALTCRNLQRLFIIFGLISVLIFAVSCASIDKGMMKASNSISSPDPVTGRRQINLLSEEKEIRKATEVTAQILAKAKKAGLKTDEETTEFRRVKTVFDRLLKVVHRRHLPWEVHVIEQKEFNAFTVGGGKVFVNTGLIESKEGVRTDDELAAVLAHEMAHVTARHVSEGQGKMLLLALADKSLRNDTFQASFTTIQEDEADRYSVIYSALAGYNPAAGIAIWRRLQKAGGSYTGNLLYTHPLNNDRSKNMSRYAGMAGQYYKPHRINPDHDAILRSNAVFSYKEPGELKAGEGGGFFALLETATSTLGEVMEAKNEEINRRNKQIEQERLASLSITFKRVRIASARGGGYGLYGVTINTTNKEIESAIVRIEYLSASGAVLESDDVKWGSLRPRQRKNFGVPLKATQYNTVRLRPRYVHFLE
ncbi:MAG: M48 family metallopeptidase [Thermodesulfobacteriota bacterium]